MDGDERTAGHGAAKVQGAGDQFLPGSALAGNQDRSARVFEAGDEAQDVLNAGGIADDAVQGGLGFGTFAEVKIFFDEANLVGHAAEEEAQFVERGKGLRNVVVGAELHGLDGGFDRSVAGHNGDFDAGMGALDLFQEFDSGHARHDHIGEDHVDGLFLEQGEGGGAALGFEAGEAERFADGHAEAADGLLVIDNQQSYAEVVCRQILIHEAALPRVCSTTVMKSRTRNGFSTHGAPVRRRVAAVSSLAISPVMKTRREASSGRWAAIQAKTWAPSTPPGVRISEMTPWKWPSASRRRASAPDSVGTTEYPWPSRTARTKAMTAGSSSINSTGALADFVPVIFPSWFPVLVSGWVILDCLLQRLQRMPPQMLPGGGR